MKLPVHWTCKMKSISIAYCKRPGLPMSALDTARVCCSTISTCWNLPVKAAGDCCRWKPMCWKLLLRRPEAVLPLPLGEGRGDGFTLFEPARQLVPHLWLYTDRSLSSYTRVLVGFPACCRPGQVLACPSAAGCRTDGPLSPGDRRC